MAGVDDPSGAALFGLASILISLSLVPLLISRTRAPDDEAPDRLGVRALLRVSPMGVVGAFLNGMMQAVFYVAIPLYALAVGTDAAAAASLVVVGALAGAAAQFPIGWASDRMDRRWMMAAAAMVATFGSALAFWTSPGVGLAAAVALIAAGGIPIYALCVAHANDQLRPAPIIPASGTLVMKLNAGLLIGALAGPSAIGLFGPTGLLARLAATNLAVGAFALARVARSEQPEDTGAARPISVQGAQTSGLTTAPAEDAGDGSQR